MAPCLKVVGSWVFPAAVAVVVNFIFLLLAWFPNHKYLMWAEQDESHHKALPDAVLDILPAGWGEEDSWVTFVADKLPPLFMVAAPTACVLTNNVLIWNRFWLTQAFVIALNCVADQSTTIPSSYGYVRCKKFMNKATDWNPNTDDTFGMTELEGTCAGMIWSGHTFHVMIGAYMLGKILEERFPWIEKHGLLIVVLLATVELILLLLDKGHYTVDVWLALIIGLLVFTNDRIEYWVFYANPFIKHLIRDDSQPKRHSDLKEMVRQLKAEVVVPIGQELADVALAQAAGNV